MTIATDLVALKNQLQALADILDQFVNGGAGETVTNGVGDVIRTIAKIEADALSTGTVATASDNTFTGANVFADGLDAPTVVNANGGIAAAFWPEGDNRAQLGARNGNWGFIGGNGYYGNPTDGFKQTVWLNDAWTMVENVYNDGSKINAVSGQPGQIGTTGHFRSQVYLQNGDFATNGNMSVRTVRATAWDFLGDITSGSPTITNLVYDPTIGEDRLLIAAMAEGDVGVYLHSNGGIGIPGDAVILSYTSTTITLDQNATASLTDADFSQYIIAPAANTENLGTDFHSFYHKPFVGTLTSGSPVITDLKFDPTRVGIAPTAKLSETDGSHITNNARLVNYTTDGVNHAIEMGDTVAGLPINALSNGTGITVNIDRGGDKLTCTGNVSTASSWITNLSINPTAQSIPVGSAWDQPKWSDDPPGRAFDAVSGAVASVSSVTSTTITMNANAKITEAGSLCEINAGLTNWFWGLYSGGQRSDVFKVGFLENPIFGFGANLTKPLWIDPVSTIPGTPTQGRWVLYVDATDSNKLKAKASTGTVVTLGTP